MFLRESDSWPLSGGQRRRRRFVSRDVIEANTEQWPDPTTTNIGPPSNLIQQLTSSIKIIKNNKNNKKNKNMSISGRNCHGEDMDGIIIIEWMEAISLH